MRAENQAENAHASGQLNGEPCGSSPGHGSGPWVRAFPGQSRQMPVLREWITSLLPDRPARHDVLIVANELAQNAVRHTASGQGGWFTAEVAVLGPLVRVTVGDQGGPDTPEVITDPDGETGRGLLLVTGLSERTGVSGGHQGRQVWADLTWDQPTATPAGGNGHPAAAIADGRADD